MAETAFQPNAFQNDAFQIDASGTGGGGSDKRPSRRIRVFITEEDEEIEQLKEEYETVAEQIADESTKKELLSVVDAYISPISQQEIDRRMRAALMLDAPPPALRIDFDNLYLNIIARTRFMNAIDRIKGRIEMFRRKQEEEAAIILLLLGV